MSAMVGGLGGIAEQAMASRRAMNALDRRAIAANQASVSAASGNEGTAETGARELPEKEEAAHRTESPPADGLRDVR
jgi:hypothetical protein